MCARRPEGDLIVLETEFGRPKERQPVGIPKRSEETWVLAKADTGEQIKIQIRVLSSRTVQKNIEQQIERQRLTFR